MSEAQRIDHPFPPLFDSESRTLILGSFPSVKSREAMFFYGHHVLLRTSSEPLLEADCAAVQ